MHIALAVAFGSVAVSPFLGRWRANAWLKKNVSMQRAANSLPEIA